MRNEACALGQILDSPENGALYFLWVDLSEVLEDRLEVEVDDDGDRAEAGLLGSEINDCDWAVGRTGGWT